MLKHFMLACSTIVVPLLLFAQTNPSPQSLPYSEDFSGLLHTGTTYPAGWQGWSQGSPSSSFSTAAPSADRSLVASSTAAINSGNVHNYDGKIGFLNTGSLDLGLVLALNTSGKKNIQVTYDIMTIRNPYDSSSNTRINELTLQYRVGTSGTFTTVSGYEYSNNTLKQTLSVTTPQKSETKTILLPPDCDSESVVQLRWISRQVSGGGSRPSFALDNISVDTAKPVSNEIDINTTAHATEGASPVVGSYTLSFTPATAAITTLDYTISGTATFSTDYDVTLSASASPSPLTTTTGTITVPVGVSTVVISVSPIDDALAEGLETVTMTVRNPSGVYHIGDSTANMDLLDDESTPIHLIQGTGMTALSGNYTIEGIVTGVFPTLSPAGFYMQEEDADADTDPNTSEGIFVVSSAAVSTGDKVKVSGITSETSAAPSYGQAVINASALTIQSIGNPLPTLSLIKLPLADTNDYEKYEAMLVRFVDTLTVTDNYYLGRYGEVGLSVGGVRYQPTQLVDVNDASSSGTTASGTGNLAALQALQLSNQLRYILLDDGRGTIPTLPFVNVDSTLRIGSTIDSLWGVMGYAYSQYRVQPLQISDVHFTYAPRPILPAVGAMANVRVASFNVLNYFNGDGTGGGFPTARGAHSAAEFTRQRDKIINAISEIDADVLGLIEMENDGTGTNAAIRDLLIGLNAKMGAGTYDYIEDGASVQTYCTDAIRCAIIYKPSVLSPVGSAMLSANAVFNRPPLAQTFKLLANDSLFSFVINHFKSKGCSGSSGLDEDQFDGQGCYNDKRKQQAGALVDFINTTLIPASGTSNVLSMGDYNAYFEEDPLDSIRSQGFTVLSKAEDFSYLFGGMMGSLDNAFVSASLEPYVTGIAKWNINSCEPTHLDYNDLIDDGGSDYSNPWAGSYTTSPFRSSDHDPVIVGLDLSKDLGIASPHRSDIALFPNPAANELHLNFPRGTFLYIQVCNALGQELLRAEVALDANTQVLDVQSLLPGVYYLQAFGLDGHKEVKAFVK